MQTQPQTTFRQLDASVKARLLKVAALARRGSGGEKETAERMLERLLAEHGLTLADLDDEERQGQVEARVFEYGDEEWSKKLLHQVLFMVVCAPPEDGLMVRDSGRGKLAIELTKAQEIEARVAFSVFSEAFKREMNNLFSAFCHRNEIFTKAEPRTKQKDTGKHDPEEIMAVMRLMAAMPRTHVRAQIEDKGGSK